MGKFFEYIGLLLLSMIGFILIIVALILSSPIISIALVYFFISEYLDNKETKHYLKSKNNK